MARTAGTQWTVRARVAGALAVAGLALGACGPLSAGLAGPSAPASAGSPTAASPLAGSWVSEITRNDLVAAGITDEGLVDENSGRFTWTFDADGTWTQVQESLDGAAIGAPVFKGLYTVNGTELVQRTTFPEQYGGDRLVFEWRIEDDGLHVDLTNPPDRILPVVMEAHPWVPATP
jgi:hypothetical protein